MLSKLLKYDLRAMYRYLIFIYILALACAVIGRLLSFLPESFFNRFISDFFIGAGSIGLPIGMLINNAIHIWDLTRQDFYSDHAYLQHTLPVPTFRLYLSKFITVLITTLTTLLVILGAVLIGYGPSSVFSIFDDAYTTLGLGETIFFVSWIVVVLYLELVFVIQSGITGLIIGYRFNNHKVLASVLVGLGIYMFCNALSVFIALVAAGFNSELRQAFFAAYASFGALKTLFIGGSVLYLTYIGLQCFASAQLLKRGVNVD